MSDLVGPDGRYLDGRPPPVLARSVRRPAGHVEIVGPVLPFGDVQAGQRPENAAETGDTLMCVHCQYQWIVRPRSGAKRGFCFNCTGPTCGKQACEESCTPFEKAIENAEAQARQSVV